MRVKFSSRLNTVLFVIPVVIILTIYFGIGFWVYFWGAADLIGDFHSAQLVTMLSDKKNGVELWFDIRCKAIEEIAASSVIVDNIRVLAEKKPARVGTEDSKDADNRELDKAAMQSMQRISKYLAGSGHFKSVSFIAGDGRLIWTAGREQPGGDSPPGDIVSKIPYGKTAVFSGKINSKEGNNEILISAPVLLKEKDVRLTVIGQLNPADLASSLMVEKGFYETGQVAIIDEHGIILAARDMTKVGGSRYDVPRGNGDGVGYRGGIFYVVAPLKFEGLRLIATLDAAEASKPLNSFLNLYLLFAGVIVLIAGIQVVVLAPRIINRPLNKLLKATQSLATGDLRAINLKKGFWGELKILSEGFSAMIVGLSRLKHAAVKPSTDISQDRSKAVMSHILAVEVKGRLDVIRKAFEAHAAACQGEDIKILEAAVDMQMLTETIEAFNLLVRHRDGSFRPAMKKLDLWAMLRDIEDESRALIGGKDIELILDSHNNLLDTTVVSDSKLLKTLMAALLRHAIRVTDVGTITLVASCETKDGTDYLELALSDTGSGIDRQTVEWTKREGLFPSHRVDLGMAREFAELLGGKLAIETLRGRGSLVTVLIPLNLRHEPEDKKQETESGSQNPASVLTPAP
jgi:signal transduction histidine kinase